MRVIIGAFFLVFWTNYAYSQPETIWIFDDLDSLEQSLSFKDMDSSYRSLMLRIRDNKATYSDYLDLLKENRNKSTFQKTAIIDFIQNRLVPPHSAELDVDYVNLKTLMISIMRDEILDIQTSTEMNLELTEYVSQFDGSSPEIIRAQILVSKHHLVIDLIEQNIAEGNALGTELFAKAQQIHDTTLMIRINNLTNDFNVYEGKLDEFISKAEYSYVLDNLLPVRTEHFSYTLTQLINALIFKGNNDERVLGLLREFASYPDIKKDGYWLYIQYLNTNPPSHITNQILIDFKVSNILELCDQIKNIYQEEANTLIYVDFLRESAKLLQNNGFIKEGQDYFISAMAENRKVYSSQLSEELAYYERKLVETEKEIEIQVQKSQTRLYSIIAALVGLLLLISIFFIYKTTRKSTLITEQKNEIEKKEKEKGLLLKELNHRVKNNFQLIIGLMEIQVMQMQNEEALNMANELKGRIRSMAYIHQNLLEIEGGEIVFDDYIKNLVEEISHSYHRENEPNITFDLEPSTFNVDIAVPLGLIVNELITNAFKYGFGDNNELIIQLKKEDTSQYKLSVADDGKGLDDLTSFDKAKSTGLRLVKRLSQQLHGEASYEYDGMAKFTINFSIA